LNATAKPINLILQHTKVHANAFLNSDGGTLCFGISDRGNVCGIPLDAASRDKIRVGIDITLKRFYPQVDPLLYSVYFRLVRQSAKHINSNKVTATLFGVLESTKRICKYILSWWKM